MLESYLVRQEPLEKADAIVVMAGNAEQRLPGAARLYHKGIAPRILLTNDGVFAGWSREYQRNLYLVEWAREDLLDKGVPGEDIVLLGYTQSGTIHDALNTREYVSAHGNVSSLLVVTSDYHSRRTLWTFQQVFAEYGVEIGVYPVKYSGDEGFGQRLPTLLMEMIKLVYYWIRI